MEPHGPGLGGVVTMETKPRPRGSQKVSIAVKGAEGVSGGAVDVEIIDDGDATYV